MNNSKIIIKRDRITLVPYLREYVDVYHRWMSDGELQDLTCSDPLSLEEEIINQREWLESGDKMTFIILENDNEKRPIGDCNIFLIDSCENGEAEAEVMIAEPSARRKGYAQEAVTGLMLYAQEYVSGITKFTAKILQKNLSSINLFTQKLGFHHQRTVAVFEEEHFRLDVGSAAWKALKNGKHEIQNM